MLMWLLNFNSAIFAIFIIVFLAIIAVKVASLCIDKKLTATILVVILLMAFVLPMFNFFYGGKGKYPKLTADKTAFSLGELWCNYAEYKCELCKDYVEYALNEQKKDRQVQFEKEQAKQQKLDDRKAQKNTIKANYENLVKEITERGMR